MNIQGIYAALACTDMRQAEAFYTVLFERPPDDRPMDGLIQWRGVANANIQIFEDRMNAGKGRMTIVVPLLSEAKAALARQDIEVTDERKGDFGRIAQTSDPDGNRIALAEPPSGP